jgi:hypothetical protein
VLRHGEPPYHAAIGVPHQAAVGEEYICEEREEGKRVSDENAASFALVAFSELSRREIPCKLVIMAHPTKDNPNKTPDSPYWKEIFKDHSELLLECHGAAPGRRELELSAGSNKLANPVAFGQFLERALTARVVLGVQAQPEQSIAMILGPAKEREGKLGNPAIKTDSLIEAETRGTPALHLEAAPAFRIPADGTDIVTPLGLVLGRAVAQAAVEYLKIAQTAET